MSFLAPLVSGVLGSPIGKKIFSGIKWLGKKIFGGGGALEHVHHIGKKIHQGVEVAKLIPGIAESKVGEVVTKIGDAAKTAAGIASDSNLHQLGKRLEGATGFASFLPGALRSISLAP